MIFILRAVAIELLYRVTHTTEASSVVLFTLFSAVVAAFTPRYFVR